MRITSALLTNTLYHFSVNVICKTSSTQMLQSLNAGEMNAWAKNPSHANLLTQTNHANLALRKLLASNYNSYTAKKLTLKDKLLAIDEKLKIQHVF